MLTPSNALDPSGHTGPTLAHVLGHKYLSCEKFFGELPGTKKIKKIENYLRKK